MGKIGVIYSARVWADGGVYEITAFSLGYFGLPFFKNEGISSIYVRRTWRDGIISIRDMVIRRTRTTGVEHITVIKRQSLDCIILEDSSKLFHVCMASIVFI